MLSLNFSTSPAYALDKIPPAIKITYTVDGSSIIGPSSGIGITFKGTSSDIDSGVKLVRVKFGWTSYVSAKPISTGNWSQWYLPYIINQQGNNIPITVDATDNAGNVGSTVIYVNVKFDNTPPTTTATPHGDYYNASQNVILTIDEPSTTYYTTDGSVPTKSSTKYTGPILVSKSTTLQYFSVDTSGNVEQVQTQIYSVGPHPPMPLGIFGSMTDHFAIYPKYLITQFDIPASYYNSFPYTAHAQTSPSLSDQQYAAIHPSSGFFKGDYLNYDIEHWTKTPLAERNNPKKSIISSCIIAHTNGYRCSVVPDRGFLMNKDPVTGLPYYKTYDYTTMDMLIIQAENYEISSSFSGYVPVVVDWVKNHSPNTKIMVEVGLANPCNTHGLCNITSVINLIMKDLLTVPKINGVFNMQQQMSQCTLCTQTNEDLLLSKLRTLPYY